MEIIISSIYENLLFPRTIIIKYKLKGIFIFMKLIDVYNDYKKDYKDYVIIINSGIFYCVYNIDIGIMYSLFKYKIKRKANYYLIGFPNNNLVKVLEVLKNNHINYLVFDKDSNDKYYITDKYKDKNNNYNKFLIDMSRIDYLNKRINNISDRLNERLFDKEIEDLLFKIEKLL